MTDFVDPRTRPAPGNLPDRPAPRTTTDPEELRDLHKLCRQRRLYDIEDWIRAGGPLQLTSDVPQRGRRQASALEIAVESGDQALTLLLLCNGYDPNLEPSSPLDIALESRRWDLLDLLLEWGADPHEVDLEFLFGTYQTDLFERFRQLGVDLTADHELARTLAYHTSNKPLFGFARRLRESDLRVQRQLNMALAHHAAEGNLKGVSLCLWTGADPHAPTRSLRYYTWADDEGDDEEDESGGWSAIWEACSNGRAEILKRLGPDPTMDDYDELYEWASDRRVIDILAQDSLPKDVTGVIAWQLTRGSLWNERWNTLSELEHLFEAGMRWTEASKEAIGNIRRNVLRMSESTFVDFMKLLARDDYASADIREELARTPAMRRKMQEVGFLPPEKEGRRPYETYRPTRSREVLKKFAVPEPKRPKPPLPHTIRIGGRREGAKIVALSRSEVYERVWSTPIVQLAKEWGLSDRGLAKACQRIKVPVPPRGYWAKVAAGKKPRRTKLPNLRAGQAEVIEVWEAD